MKTLLRSTFRVDHNDNPELFLRNSQALRDSGLSFDHPEDSAMWTWIQDFVSEYHHVPDASTIRSHFDSVNQQTIVDRLDNLVIEKPRSQGDFLKLLGSRLDDRRLRLTTEILREAGNIAVTGVTVKDGKKETHLRGAIHALQYVVDRAVEVVTPNTGIRLTGDATTDGVSFAEEYQRIENDPLAGIGQLTGVQQMDLAMKGSKRGELWTHAAFTGGLKSTFAVNFHYNQAIYYKFSSVLFSLEMPYPQVRRTFNAIHSSHPKFAGIRDELKIKKALDYEKIRDGELSPSEKIFLMEYVIPDLNNPANEYGHLHVEVADPDKSDFTILDLKSKSELLYSKDPRIRMITVDHAGLMQSRNKHPSTTERLNEVLRDSKRFAMSFNRGMGIAVNALFQISREGFKAAEKTGGKYNLTHLSYANEAERSSDNVTASWVDAELEESNLVKFMHLKSRDNKKFSDFHAGVLWKCRRLYSVSDITRGAARKTGEEIDLGL